MPIARIESLDHDGRGVTHHEGKVIFVDGALTGEVVDFSPYRRKPSYEFAQISRIIRPSSQRVAPGCAHFGICGGCSMQHLDAAAQVAVKQRVLEDALWHLARVKPEVQLPALAGPTWGYRRRARLTVRLVPKKGGVLVGFHERKSSFVADMGSCPVLSPHVSALLLPLRELIGAMSCPDRLPQIEVAVGDDATALVLRHLEPLTPDDLDRLDGFARRHGVAWWLQPGGPATAHPMLPEQPAELHYALPEFGVRMMFRPTDFTQVNHDINRVLVRRALRLLDPRPGERVADLFCGLGNFTLAMARSGAQVFGVEGSGTLVERAADNALRNGLAERCSYAVADLFKVDEAVLAGWGRFDKLLIDPPREGAVAVCKALPAADAAEAPVRMVYVSCNPATLARDVAVLVHEKGYALKGAGIANMFPHTSHVESIALIERP
jgi:23S rRNA (uracil1939-C5)-methyltransferase